MGATRRSIRIPGYDYREPGAYFVTICTRDRAPILGAIDSQCFQPTAAGSVVAQVWAELPNHYLETALDAFVVMPNHVHGILFLTAGPLRSAVGAGLRPAPPLPGLHGLPEVIRGFKSFSARRINLVLGLSGRAVWQRGYFEHVIRTDRHLARLREYVSQNVARWELDRRR